MSEAGAEGLVGKNLIVVRDGVASIHLGSDEVSLIDADDVPVLNRRRVVLIRDHPFNKYAVVLGPRRTRTLLHRLIVGAPKGSQVDHIDGDGLNNRRSNLRIATAAQNGWNTGPKRTNRSGFKGVSWRADRGKWQVHIRVGSKRLSLGHYANIQEAAEAYAAAAREHHGEFANLGKLEVSA